MQAYTTKKEHWIEDENAPTIGRRYTRGVIRDDKDETGYKTGYANCAIQ